MNKQKKKKCIICGKMFPLFRSTQKVCSYECSLTHIENEKERKKKDAENIDKLILEKKERSRLPTMLKQTQIVFNKYIRLRDRFKPCISSGNPWKDDHDAGHLYSVKQYSALRFNEFNCHGQSIGDNRFKDGNFEDYIVNIKDRIGEDNLRELQRLAEESKNTVKKWTYYEVLAIKKKYSKKVKELENNL